MIFYRYSREKFCLGKGSRGNSLNLKLIEKIKKKQFLVRKEERKKLFHETSGSSFQEYCFPFVCFKSLFNYLLGSFYEIKTAHVPV